MIEEVNWKNFLSTMTRQALCDDCQQNLIKLSGKRCLHCSRKSKEEICSDCRWWQQQNRDSLEFNYSVFVYNEFMKELVAKWKYRGDYRLASIFENDFSAAFQQTFSFLKKDYILIPVPLSKERLKERAFNQSKQLTDFLPGKTEEILSRVHGEKQSKKNRAERIATGNPFLVTKNINKPVILVDDIYTTGTTLRHAAALLKMHGSPEIYAFTLIRG